MKNQFTIVAMLISAGLFAQTSIQGTVKDAKSGEPLAFVTIALYQNGILKNGTETDVDGYYKISEIDPGPYDIEISYAGYEVKRISECFVTSGKSIKLDAKMESRYCCGCLICIYIPPLIYQDNMTQGHVFSRNEIRHSPFR
jgi:hypothetical protein